MDLASFFQRTLETRWLGLRKTCGIGHFYRNHMLLLEETGWLGSDFISVCLATMLVGSNTVVSMCRDATVYRTALGNGARDRRTSTVPPLPRHGSRATIARRLRLVPCVFLCFM